MQKRTYALAAFLLLVSSGWLLVRERLAVDEQVAIRQLMPPVRGAASDVEEQSEVGTASATGVVPADESGADDAVAVIEAEAFRLAGQPENRLEARALFVELFSSNPADDLAVAMIAALSVKPEEKTSALDTLRAGASSCSGCMDARLVAVDLLLSLGRKDEARADIAVVSQHRLTEAQARHLSAQLLQLGDQEGARRQLENALAMRKRELLRSRVANTSDLTVWNESDRRRLDDLTARDGQNPGSL